VELIKVDSFVDNSLAPIRLVFWGIDGCVMGVFSHGAPSSIPLEFEKLAIVMRDDQGSLWTTTFQFVICASSRKNNFWAW
jgi:hypothetical protein